MRWVIVGLGFAAMAVSGIAGCATPQSELERVARDWCETIRASQVLPVYPLSEDIQPGDVFIVQTPMSQQAKAYREKGFLPLDQLVTRLPFSADAKKPGRLPYETFYRDSYWLGDYAKASHARPIKKDDAVTAPRAAFPTYTFSVQRGVGLQLAIPIQGVPAGLGIMGASRATGSVTIKDAYTYGVDCASLVSSLEVWWSSDPKISALLTRVVKETDQPVYLRVVNRVYLTRGVSVTLTNLDTVGGGADAGQSPEVKLLDLSVQDPTKAEASAKAYQETVKAINATYAGSTFGGSFRFAQASQRSVTLDETFDRPLVIGYLGFDVRVYRDGTLSPPIPSFSVLNGRPEGVVEAVPYVADDGLSDCYIKWLRVAGNRDRMVAWLEQENVNADPADLANSAEHSGLLRRADAEFKFCPQEP